MSKILRKSKECHKVQFPKLSVYVDQKLILYNYYNQNFKVGIQIYKKTIKM